MRRVEKAERSVVPSRHVAFFRDVVTEHRPRPLAVSDGGQATFAVVVRLVSHHSTQEKHLVSAGDGN